MKNTVLLLLCIFYIENLYGQNFYHSEASLPYSSLAIKTNLELILDKDNTNPLDFAVVVAKDNDLMSYILLAQFKAMTSGEELTDINFSRLIPIPQNKTGELLQLVETAIKTWKNQYSKTTGLSYEYLFAPENKIVPQSPNVVNWESSLSFFYENNSDGPKATLFIGASLDRKEYNLDEEVLTKFHDMLKAAIAKLNN